MFSHMLFADTGCAMADPVYADFRPVLHETPATLFQRVVELTRLPVFLGRRVVMRALEARGFDPRKARAEDYLEALPELEHYMGTTGPRAAAGVNIRDIQAHVMAQFQMPLAM